jgi:hypothetical protein
VPANAVALVMKADPGADLACRARNYRFAHDTGQRERGVISYYAAHTLPQATTLGSWLRLIETRSGADHREGRLPWVYQPSLQVLGPSSTRLPGVAVGTGDEQRR